MSSKFRRSLSEIRRKYKGRMDLSGVSFEKKTPVNELFEKGVPLFEWMDVGDLANSKIPEGFLQETFDLFENFYGKDRRERLERLVRDSLIVMDKGGYLSRARDTEERDILLHVASYVLGKLRSFFNDVELEGYTRNRCPFCGVLPLCGYIHGGKKILVCGICGGTWSYPLVKCVFCGAENLSKVGYLWSEDEEYVKAYLCSGCMTFFKVFDLGSAGISPDDADFDELYEKTLFLDVEARERGYRSIFEASMAPGNGK